MTIYETTRIEFAERQGWKKAYANAITGCWYKPNSEEVGTLPDPTDANHVHAALLGMNDEEWAKFSYEVSITLVTTSTLTLWAKITKAVLKTPLPVLVSCYLEATKWREPK